MIEIRLKNDDGSIAHTVINVKYVRWMERTNGDLYIWILGIETALVFNNKILYESTVEDIYKRIKVLIMK